MTQKNQNDIDEGGIIVLVIIASTTYLFSISLLMNNSTFLFGLVINFIAYFMVAAISLYKKRNKKNESV